MSTIDTLLYRPLKQGTAFEGLIPAYKGTDFKFDKNSDNSTTYDTLRFMAQWSTKYASQMKRIAPLLRGKTIEETANNIYQFLYHHFQYKLDGEMQNLYSPSAAWHFRKTGFDCKTYSILASTILQNLNITHAFRMVQQAGIMPGEWSHVYVVIPNGNNYAIIDATTHTNKEVSFTKKHDYTMKHRGLASPYINGLGCACNGKPITRTGLGNPATMATTVAHFHTFLNELETKGVPKEVANRMLDLVKINIQNGIDPNMHEIVTKAYAGTNQGLGATFLEQGVDAGMSAINNINVGGVNVGNVGSQLVNGNFVGAGLTIVNEVIPLDKTFGQVFANGFDLSCWGSSTPPDKMKARAIIDIPAVYAASLGKGVSQQNLNLFLDYINHLIYRCRQRVPQVVKCSGKGLSQYADAAEKAKAQVIAAMREQYVLTPTTPVRITKAPIPSGFAWNFTYLSTFDKPYDSERYIISNIAPPAPEETNNNSASSSPKPPKKSSSLLLPLVGVGVLAAKFLI